MLGDFERFDTARPPKRQWHILRPVIWAISFPVVRMKRAKIKKTDMDGIKPPYLLLCNHNAFLDFMVMTAAIFPHRANYVVAIDGFLISEWLLRAVGCFGVRKFTHSVTLVRNMKRVVQNGDVVVLFPEARYSLCGTQSEIPESVAKLAKHLGVPVVSLIMNGHHIDSPFWNPKSRKSKHLESELKLLIDTDRLAAMPVGEISEIIDQTFVYDDFNWQKINKIPVKSKRRAEGLHKVLYQCPSCGAEYEMNSGGAELWCEHCGKRWEMTEYGELAAKDGKTEFSHIPDWYEWERGNVRREVASGEYYFDSAVRVESLPNAKRFINLGEGRLTHSLDGFELTVDCQGKTETVRWLPGETYACHIEYNYKKRGDCVDLNTDKDTLYIYPLRSDFSVTKIELATEEIYKLASTELPTKKRAVAK